MFEKIEMIRRKMFPIKYLTLREYFFLLLIGPFVMSWYVIISSAFLKFEPFIFDPYILIPTFAVNLWSAYCGSYRPMQSLFKKKGTRYKGRIIRAERMCGAGEDTYYFFIKFRKGKKTLIRRTSGYMGNPNIYLENDICGIYEYRGRFIETDFNVRKVFPKNENECLHIKITPHKMFMPKGDKYV